MGKKNEYRINLIQDQFLTEDKLAVHENKTLKRDIEEINKKTDKDLEKRLKDRKVKEFEAKVFQDKQVAEKNQKKQLEVIMNKGDQARVLKDVQDFH